MRVVDGGRFYFSVPGVFISLQSVVMYMSLININKHYVLPSFSFSQAYNLSSSLCPSVYATGCETDEAVGCVVVVYFDKFSLKQLHSHVL